VRFAASWASYRNPPMRVSFPDLFQRYREGLLAGLIRHLTGIPMSDTPSWLGVCQYGVEPFTWGQRTILCSRIHFDSPHTNLRVFVHLGESILIKWANVTPSWMYERLSHFVPRVYEEYTYCYVTVGQQASQIVIGYSPQVLKAYDFEIRQ
jgi:hypothetical protein